MNVKKSDLKSSRRQVIIGGATIMATTAASAAQTSEAMAAKPADITKIAMDFFVACETGKGWEVCKVYCTDSATFSSQTDALKDMNTIEAYTTWTKNILTPIADGSYDLKSFATDTERNSVCAYAVFIGSHTGDGGPVPPTGNKASTDYVYYMQFEGDRISHMTKIWNDVQALRQLGWA